MNSEQYSKSKYKGEIKELWDNVEQKRKDASNPVDIGLFDAFREKHPELDEKTATGELFQDIGIDPSTDSLGGIITLPDVNSRYFAPEIIRDAIRLGLRKTPIYPNIIASEQNLNAMRATMPWINMSDADAKWVEEAETIQFGGISYGAKDIKTRKMGRGIKLTDEVMLYSTLNVVQIFLQDFGVRLGYGLDSLAIDTLLNGDQADGSDSAIVIGVQTANTITYKDLLTIWVRLSRMGKNATTMIAGEQTAVDVLDMDVFKQRVFGAPLVGIDVKTPIPTKADMFIHGGVPDDQIIILDPKSTMMKFNSRPLLVESERIVSNQTEATYASLTTGFATMFRDSRIVLDTSIDFATHGFPTFMNVSLLEQSQIK